MSQLVAARLVLLVVLSTAACAWSWGAVPGASVAAPATADGEEGQLLVIMDVSGSMERRDASGTTLIQGARDAVRGFVDDIPVETEVGLRLYGSDYAGDAKGPGCRDTRLAVPIAPASESAGDITAAIDAAEPTGFTPIGFSLAEAARDFSVEGERSIVLVSDGEDTCGSPAPCDAARDLAKSGIKVRVDTVGLFLRDNAAARKQLECIADATGGTYVPADDTAALSQQLTAVAGRAVARFRAAGAEIDGGPAQTQAAAIESGTSYVDDILKGEARWYSLELSAGQVVTVTGTDDGTADYGCCIRWALVAPDASEVGGESGYNESGTASTYVVASPEDGVVESGTYYVAVTLDDTIGGGIYDAVSYEFAVEASGPVATTTETPTATASPSETPTETGPSSSSASPTSPTSPTTASSDSSGSVPASLWVLVGVLVLVVLTLAVLVVVLMRRVASPPR